MSRQTLVGHLSKVTKCPVIPPWKETMQAIKAAAPRSMAGLSILAACVFLTTGCNIDFATGSSLDIAGGGLTGVGVDGDSVVAVGDTIRLWASGSVGGLVGMFSYDPLDDAVWATGRRVIATVTRRESGPDEVRLARAVVRGMHAGTTTIYVSARGFTATRRVRVVPSTTAPWAPLEPPVP